MFTEKAAWPCPAQNEAGSGKTLIALVECDRLFSSPGIGHTLPFNGHGSPNSDQISGA